MCYLLMIIVRSVGDLSFKGIRFRSTLGAVFTYYYTFRRTELI